MLNQDTANFIIERAGNIPYYIQLLAAEIWQTVIEEKKEVKKEAVKAAAELYK